MEICSFILISRQTISPRATGFRDEPLRKTIMRIGSFTQSLVCPMLGIGVPIPATAQKLTVSGETAENSVVPSRVVDHVDDAKLARLTGNVHPMAQAGERSRGLCSNAERRSGRWPRSDRPQSWVTSSPERVSLFAITAARNGMRFARARSASSSKPSKTLSFRAFSRQKRPILS